MKPILISLTLISSLAFAKDSVDVAKTKALELASRNEVELRLDQPYAENANPRQRVDLYLPKKRAGNKPLPVIVLIHAGGWRNGDRIDYAATAVQLARSGDFAVVAVGYRLTGEAKWPAQIHDCKAAIRYVRAHAKEWNIDPERIAAWGASAGGHLASLVGTSGDVKALEGIIGNHTEVSSRVQCVVNQCGPQDLTQALMFDEKTQAPIMKDKAIIGLLGGTAEEKPAEARAASPITYVSNDDPPFITIHGDADPRVDFSHAERIHAALQKAGVTSLLIPIHNGGHASAGNKAATARSEAFLRKIFLGMEADIPTRPVGAEDKK